MIECYACEAPVETLDYRVPNGGFVKCDYYCEPCAEAIRDSIYA